MRITADNLAELRTFDMFWELFRNNKYTTLCNDAKLLYCMVRSYLNLSCEKNWIDEDGVYVEFSRQDVAKVLNVGMDKARNLFDQLKEVGLIEENVSEKKIYVNRIEGTPGGGYGAIVKFYQNNFGLITPHIAEFIESYLDDGIQDELILKYMQIAIANNKRNFAYVKACMENSKSKNIYTIEQYEAALLEKNAKKVDTVEKKSTSIGWLNDAPE